MFGSTCTGGFAKRPTFVGKILTARTSGAILRPMKARLTSSRAAGDVELFKTARHCRYLVFGLAIWPPFGSARATLQTLHVSSGFSVLPVRVWIETFPLELHQMRPHVAVVLASSTEESYVPSATVSGPNRNSEPWLLEVAIMFC